MANPAADPLAALRDIQTPDPVSWWPLAPGWWVLAALLLGLLIWLGVSLRRAQRRRREFGAQQQWLMAELNAIEQQAKQHPREALNQLSQLLRRCALKMQAASFESEQPVAGLHGDEWLSWLHHHGGESLDKHREWLLEAPYRAGNHAPPAQLFDDSRTFLNNAAPALAGRPLPKETKPEAHLV